MPEDHIQRFRNALQNALGADRDEEERITRNAESSIAFLESWIGRLNEAVQEIYPGSSILRTDASLKRAQQAVDYVYVMNRPDGKTEDLNFRALDNVLEFYGDRYIVSDAGELDRLLQSVAGKALRFFSP